MKASRSLLLQLALLPAVAAGVAPSRADSIAQIGLHEVRVTARPLALTGLTRVSLDSVALHRNPSHSLADVIALEPSVFVKTSGRATLSTVSFRGTSPSHTLVEWNGLPVNSPMLGMTDFSLLPAWMIDRAELLNGSSSVEQGGGGLGGAVKLATSTSDLKDGWSGRIVSGFGSFTTFDEFGSVAFSNATFSTVTRIAYSRSRNNFSYVNHDKKLNIYDDDHNIIAQYHPREHNENGAYRDLHILEQLAWQIDRRNRLEADIWWLDSRRELPLTTVDYSQTSRYENLQRENTLRGVVTWNRSGSRSRSKTRGGIIRSWSAYNYGLDNGSGTFNRLTAAHTHVTTLTADYTLDLLLGASSTLSVSGKAWLDKVDSRDFASLTGALGYDRSRGNGSVAASLRHRFNSRAALAATLREELHGNRFTLPIAAIHGEYLLFAPWALTARASVSRNETVPTLNDLYYVPGGNPDLQPERALNYDIGLTFNRQLTQQLSLDGAVTWHDSYISDWILWLPTPKGFFSPRNVRNVHSYGTELTLSPTLFLNPKSSLALRAGYSFTPSINTTRPTDPSDKSYKKQLPYIPRHTFSFSASYRYGRWSATLTGLYYSRRFTMSSNESTIGGAVNPYFIADATVERSFPIKKTTFSVKAALNNLFNADYITILSRPMPGFNFNIYLSLSF